MLHTPLSPISHDLLSHTEHLLDDLSSTVARQDGGGRGPIEADSTCVPEAQTRRVGTSECSFVANASPFHFQSAIIMPTLN